MMRKILLSGLGGTIAFGIFAAGAHAAPGQFLTLDKSPQTNNNLLRLVRGGHRFHHGFRGGGFGSYYGISDDDYGYVNGCFWRYGRWICPGYGGYGY